MNNSPRRDRDHCMTEREPSKTRQMGVFTIFSLPSEFLDSTFISGGEGGSGRIIQQDQLTMNAQQMNKMRTKTNGQSKEKITSVGVKVEILIVQDDCIF